MVLCEYMQYLYVNVQKVVGDNIRNFRVKLGWSQEKLGVMSKLHYNYIGTVERAEDNISILSLFKIAKALKIKPHLLMIENVFQLPDDILKLLNKF
jgi:transcriptional regulator with XRE-family HTH domain